ncbi:NAD-dependent epimerase/dehydratase family protein [Polaromonas sp. P1(28)-8]|nr:NAD-dependent epimerase/dehydratase family protein [Polaromonas sp. P1(28)-8]
MKILRVLVLGGSGHIGKQLVETLKNTAWAIPVSASRRTAGAGNGNVETLRVDSRDLQALTAALEGFDAVVNCVAGDARSISEGARARAGRTGHAVPAHCSPEHDVGLWPRGRHGPRRHGDQPQPRLVRPGQMRRGKAHARDLHAAAARSWCCGPAAFSAPAASCGSAASGRWLQTGRLGDLGAAGDGWSNLVHVDDVCRALIAALQLPVRPGDMPVFNLAAPDSPRWNDYFVDLALALHATPVPRIGPRQLRLDALLAGPPLKVMQLALKRLGRPASGVPDPMPPGLIRLWAQHIHLDATLAEQTLGVTWTPYAVGLQSCADWFTGNTAQHSPPLGNAVCTP